MEEKKELTQEEKLRRQKFVIIPAVVLVGILIMWFIFAPSDKDKEEQKQGFNTEIPEPDSDKMEGDKTKVYKNDMLTKKQQERKEIKDLAMMLSKENKNGKESTAPADDLYLDDKRKEVKSTSVSTSRQSITSSTNAYRNINKTLGGFYDTPKVDTEKEDMQKQIEELQAQLKVQKTPQSGMDEQLVLLEKSYELAAKYMPQNGGVATKPIEPEPTTSSGYKNGKAQIVHIKQVREAVVTSLAQPMSDSAFIVEYSKPRNTSFNTAVGKSGVNTKNTINACVHNNQTIVDGQSVRMRLLEPMMAGDKLLPKNAIITGFGKIQGERLFINITNLEHKGVITPVELSVVDSDGQEGIFIPGSMEMSAIKEVAANLGSNLGTTINLNQQSAGNQILTDLGKGAIQGASQYIGNKMRIVKVHLKSGYKLMLFQHEN